MPRSEDLDRTLELPAEPVDDLEPLESTTAGPIEPRPDRIQTVSRPLPFDEVAETIPDVAEREAEREITQRGLSLAEHERRHQHAVELARLDREHDRQRQRLRQESRIAGAVLLLLVASGLAWIVMPVTDAAQIVFTTSFGVVAGYLVGRSRRASSLPS